MRGVPPKLTTSEPTEVKEEGNLLIEAVSLLVQRQRETEGWVAEQIWQAEERAAATERRYAELESRLVGIEEHLARLVHDVEPMQGDAVDDERLARLREQVEGLKSAGADGYTARGAPVAPPAPAPMPAAPAYESDVTQPMPTVPKPAYLERPVAPAQGIGFLELLGATPQDRWSVVLIGTGSVAVLWAALTLVRFG
jgi:cell division septation protein DedD